MNRRFVLSPRPPPENAATRSPLFPSLEAFSGDKGVTECTFVENGLTDAPFFSTPCTLGPKGVEEIHAYGALSAFEQENFDKMMPDLVAQAAKGVAFVKK